MGKANEQGLIHNLVHNGVNMLQRANGTIFMFKDDLESVRNVKLIICLLEHLSGLKVTFHKSEI